MKTTVACTSPTLTIFEKNQLFDLRPDLPHTWPFPEQWCHFHRNLRQKLFTIQLRDSKKVDKDRKNPISKATVDLKTELIRVVHRDVKIPKRQKSHMRTQQWFSSCRGVCYIVAAGLVSLPVP